MSKVYLSEVESSSKLDSYTGLPVSSIDDGLGSSKSSPFLLEWSPESKRNKPTPLLGGVLLKNAFKFSNEPNLDELEGSRFSARRLSTSLKNLDEVDGPSGVNSKGAHGDGRDSYHSSFGDLLQSRDSDEHQELMKSSFTNWVNDRLKAGKQGAPKILNLSTDLRDGLMLIRLLESLTKKKIKGYTKNPKMPAHQLDNLDLAIKFMREEGLKLIGIGSMNIFEGNLKLTLGMIWVLIQKYQLRISGYKTTTKVVMLQWLQALIPSLNLSNLTTDWTDGRALLALINVVKPGTAHVPDDSDPTRALTNCSQAMRLAEAHLKVPRIIEPEHLASGHIDELSMITYLSYFVEPAQAKLKKWVKRALPHASITNFTSNWFDGVHFLALMNICFPGSLPKFTKMTKQDANQNVSVFYETCKTKLRFEPHYSNEDLVAGKVDELQVMTTILQVQNGKLQSMPEAVVVSGNGLDIAKIGKDNTFTISTMEAGPGKLNVEAYYEDGRKLKFKLKEKVGGVLTLSYMPPTQGRLIFDVQWSDVPVPNSPFTVLALNPSMIHILDFDNHAKVRDAGKEVEVKLEMKQATKVSNISAHLSYSKGHRVEAKVTEAEGSTAILKFTPVLAGNATLQVFLNKRELSHLSVSYTIVDSGGYQIESLPKKSTYETFEEVEFTITSMKKLSLNVLQMTAVLTDDIQFPFSFKSIQGSLGLASFKPTLAGEYKVEVTCAEIAIQGSPFSVNVVDPMECKLSSTIPSNMELNKPYIFELETNAKNLDYIKFEVVGKDGSIFNVDYVHREENSIALLKVTAVAEGSFMVGVKLQDQWVPGCPFQLTVCNPSKFQISRDLQDRKSAVVGEAVHISIESMEVGAFESKLLPVVTASGPTAKYSPKHHLREDRQALMFQFTPYEIGTHEVSILYGGFSIPSSPIFINVVAYNSHTFSASGSGLQEAYTNVPGQFMILTKRTGLLENKILQVKVAGVVNGKECSIDVKDNRNGSYYVEYMITNPGAYLITVLAGGTHIPGSPFKLTALPGPNPHRCKMSGPALNESEVFTLGQSIDFTVDVTKGGTGKLVTKATGPEGVTARVFVAKNSMSKGIHDIKIDPVHHGRYEVSVKWSGTDIPGSPFIINVFPGVDASKCRAYGRGLENGRVGSLAEFYIETHNAGSGNLYVGIHSVQDTCKIVVKPKDMKDVRTQVARYFPRKPGNFIISVTWSDKHIPGSPFKVKITGEAMEDNFKPNKYKPPTRNDELESITEEAEEGDDDLFDIDFDISSVVSRTRESQHSLSQKVPSVKSLDEIGMPSFQRTGIDRGFQQTFTKSDQLMSKSLTHISKGSTATSKPKRKVVAKRKVKRKAAATAKANGPKSGSLK